MYHLIGSFRRLLSNLPGHKADGESDIDFILEDHRINWELIRKGVDLRINNPTQLDPSGELFFGEMLLRELARVYNFSPEPPESPLKGLYLAQFFQWSQELLQHLKEDARKVVNIPGLPIYEREIDILVYIPLEMGEFAYGRYAQRLDKFSPATGLKTAGTLFRGDELYPELVAMTGLE